MTISGTGTRLLTHLDEPTRLTISTSSVVVLVFWYFPLTEDSLVWEIKVFRHLGLKSIFIFILLSGYGKSIIPFFKENNFFFFFDEPRKTTSCDLQNFIFHRLTLHLLSCFILSNKIFYLDPRYMFWVWN